MEKPGRLCTVAVIVAMLSILGGCGQKPHPVHIGSEPAGALVFLNDKVIGETPFDTLVEQRKGDYNIYTFKVLKEDYKPVKRAFKEQLYHETVSDLIPADLHFVLEKRKKYDISITSTPSGALLTLNGEVIGETPCTATIRERIGDPRVFDFVAVKDGYEQGRTVLREFLAQENGAVFEFPETLHFDLIKQAGLQPQ
jgi:hypothetical protein